MKKVFAFAAFALFLAACSNTAKFKPMIEELSSKWDSTTSAVTEFATMVKTEQSNWMNAVSSMQVAPEAMVKWDEATKTKYNEIQTAAQVQTDGISSIVSNLDALVTQWQAKSSEVQALKDGLAAGKLEGDVAAKIADLNNVVNEATTTVDGLKQKFEQVKAEAANSQKQFADFMASMPAAKPVR